MKVEKILEFTICKPESSERGKKSSMYLFDNFQIRDLHYLKKW